MKCSMLPSLGLIVVLAITALGCGKQEVQPDTAGSPPQSLENARPEVKGALQDANSHLRARDYSAAAKSLEPVVLRQNLTEPEKQAVAGVLQNINQAIAADRSLDTKEMYELRAKMFHAIHNTGKRF